MGLREERTLVIRVRVPRLSLRRVNRAYVIGLIVALASVIATGAATYSTVVHLKGYVSDEIYYAGVAANMNLYMFDTDSRVPLPPHQLAYGYWNLEHPPLAKYILVLAEWAGGGGYMSYRWPSIIMTSLMPLIAYLAVTYPFPDRDARRLALAGAVASVIFPLESIVRNEGGLALLDVYATFFVMLSLAFAMQDKYLLAAFFAGLAAASKETAVPIALAVVIAYYLNSRSPRRVRLLGALLTLSIAVVVFLASYLPLAAYLGPQVMASFVGTAKWDIVSRPSGPTPSQPIDWFLGIRSMYFIVKYVQVQTQYGFKTIKVVGGLAARMTPAVELPALTLVLLSAVSSLWGRRVPRDPAFWYYVVELLGFYAVYIVGNHTLYSMYAIVFVPMVSILWAEIAYLLSRSVKVVW